jgi:F-type H+-transporting ATPase subunit a
MKIPIFEYEVIKPFARFGLDGKFWDVHIDTLIQTWIAMAFLFVLVYVGRIFIKKGLNPVSLVVEESVGTFVNLCKESFGHFKYDYFAFITSLFFFVLFCNIVGTLPFIEEPTKDLNTALACGITGFLYVQYQNIKTIGLWAYIKGYTKPIFILLPLNIIGELAKAISMSFRLFGNILGGSIVLYILISALDKIKIPIMIYVFIVIILSLIVKRFINRRHAFIHKILYFSQMVMFSIAGIQIFFGLFEAVVQAFVITMLIVTYLAIIVQSNSSNDEDNLQEDPKTRERGALC